MNERGDNRQRHDRGGQGGDQGRGGSRPPSQWKTEATFTSGQMVGEITSRPGRDGRPQYSCSSPSRKESRNGEDFFSRFMRPPQDLRDAIVIIQQMLTWYEADQHEKETEAANG